jgi:UDP-N-acetyl-D-mannosaminuronic acid dehydrogenase
MPTILHLKPEEINSKEKRGKYTVCVVGCEEKGVLYAAAFAEAGFKVTCTDIDQTMVKSLSKGKMVVSNREIEPKVKSLLRRGRLDVTSELQKAVSQSDIVVMTLTAKFDGKKQPDYSEVENACKQVGKALSRGALFIYGGVAGLGFTEGVVKETLEDTSGLKVGEDFGLVYCPVRFFGRQSAASVVGQELTVAGLDGASLDSAAQVLSEVAEKEVKQVSDIKVVEAALLFSIAKRDASLALANELAVFCESAGVDYFEALKFVDVDDAGFSPAVESEEVGGSDAGFLFESAESLNVKLRLPVLARKINEDIVRHAINLTKDALRSCGKTLRRGRVAVFGNAKPKAATVMFVKMLERRGAKVSLYDSLLSKTDFSDVARALKRSMKEAVEGADCLVVLTEQDQFKRLNLKRLIAVMRKPAALVDLTGMFEPKKVERKGFMYRGLGRGAGKK